MIKKANEVKKNAYVPISHFPVGSCLITPEGQFFMGCNLENLSFSLTLCAESAAIASMISNGYREIAEIVVIAEKTTQCPPCGSCLQRIQEFSTPSTIVHWCDINGDHLVSNKIRDLLPIPFDPKCLIES